MSFVENVETVEKAIGHLNSAIAELRFLVDDSFKNVQGDIEALRDDLQDFAEQMEDTIYRMNRDRDGYDRYDE